MRAFSTKGIAVRSFFGLNARTIANPTGPPAGSGPPAGKTWTLLTTGFDTSADQYAQIFYLNGRWIITTTQPGVRQTVLVSTNGTIWTQRLVINATTAIQTPAAAFGA